MNQALVKTHHAVRHTYSLSQAFHFTSSPDFTASTDPPKAPKKQGTTQIIVRAQTDIEPDAGIMTNQDYSFLQHFEKPRTKISFLESEFTKP